MLFYKTVLTSHIAAGSIALAAFWITAALPKGTSLHRRVGGTYLLAMAAVILSAIPLCIISFVTGRTLNGVFLAYLVLITSTAIYTGWRAVRDRRSVAAYIGNWYRPVAWLNLVGGATVLGVGLYSATSLLVGMSVLGLVVGYRMLRFMARPPTNRTWWLQRHFTALVASGAAAHIAFLNLGLRRLLPVGGSGWVTYVGWFGPFIAATFAIIWLNRRYAQGVGGKRLREAAGSGAAQSDVPGVKAACDAS
jgi:uncharacterized membrane protein